MKIFKLSFLLTVFFSMSTNAYLVNGKMLLNDYEKRKIAATGYIEGISDTGNNSLFCIPAGTGTSQLKAVALQYLKSNPDLLEQPAAYLVTRSFKEVFPCSNDSQ